MPTGAVLRSSPFQGGPVTPEPVLESDLTESNSWADSTIDSRMLLARQVGPEAVGTFSLVFAGCGASW